MRDVPRSGIEPVSPSLAGGFFTTKPPKHLQAHYFLFYVSLARFPFHSAVSHYLPFELLVHYFYVWGWFKLFSSYLSSSRLNSLSECLCHNYVIFPYQMFTKFLCRVFFFLFLLKLPRSEVILSRCLLVPKCTGGLFLPPPHLPRHDLKTAFRI